LRGFEVRVGCFPSCSLLGVVGKKRKRALGKEKGPFLFKKRRSVGREDAEGKSRGRKKREKRTVMESTNSLFFFFFFVFRSFVFFLFVRSFFLSVSFLSRLKKKKKHVKGKRV